MMEDCFREQAENLELRRKGLTIRTWAEHADFIHQPSESRLSERFSYSYSAFQTKQRFRETHEYFHAVSIFHCRHSQSRCEVVAGMANKKSILA